MQLSLRIDDISTSSSTLSMSISTKCSIFFCYSSFPSFSICILNDSLQSHLTLFCQTFLKNNFDHFFRDPPLYPACIYSLRHLLWICVVWLSWLLLLSSLWTCHALLSFFRVRPTTQQVVSNNAFFFLWILSVSFYCIKDYLSSHVSRPSDLIKLLLVQYFFINIFSYLFPFYIHGLLNYSLSALTHRIVFHHISSYVTVQLSLTDLFKYFLYFCISTALTPVTVQNVHCCPTFFFQFFVFLLESVLHRSLRFVFLLWIRPRSSLYSLSHFFFWLFEFRSFLDYTIIYAIDLTVFFIFFHVRVEGSIPDYLIIFVLFLFLDVRLDEKIRYTSYPFVFLMFFIVLCSVTCLSLPSAFAEINLLLYVAFRYRWHAILIHTRWRLYAFFSLVLVRKHTAVFLSCYFLDCVLTLRVGH